jgi:hypothetical protein
MEREPERKEVTEKRNVRKGENEIDAKVFLIACVTAV